MNRPVPSPGFRKVMIGVASIVCVFYLAYRAFYTFNLNTPYATFASIFLYVGEMFGILNLLLFFLQVWEVKEPPPQPVLEGRTVDVLVPTYNEDLQILRATLEACMRLDYPHKTFVLDDGHRPEVEILAHELGVSYITRPDNRHFKAGNLNNALERTEGEFVVVLDADHVPEPHFITRLIGYFSDDRVAYVQTPHAFYNFDSFQARLEHSKRRYWEEGDLFYRVIQPGRNHWNASIFAGSATMFRRSALREIGYIATETVTEDLHTGLRLHERGWKSIAITERMIAGQAPPDIRTFHTQRLRWGEGNLSIMAYDNPITARGLNLYQRLCYTGSMIHWASGLFKLAIYLTPILMLFTGVPPVREFTWDLIIITLTYLFVSLYATKVVSNGYGSIINSELFSMVNFWTQIKSTFRAMFRRRTQQFNPTDKRPVAMRESQQRSVWPFVRPQTYLIILSALALVWGWGRLSLQLNPFKSEWVDQGLHAIAPKFDLHQAIAGTPFERIPSMKVGTGISDDYFKPIVPTIWVLIFFWLAYKVTQRTFWPTDRRLVTRHLVHLPVEYEVSTELGTAVRYGVTVDLNDTGMALVAYEELPQGSLIRLTVRGGGEVIKCKGEIRSKAPLGLTSAGGGYRYGIQFQNLTAPQADALNRVCLQYAVPRMYEEYERGSTDTFWHRMRNWSNRGGGQRRNALRNPYHLPLILNTGQGEETTQYTSTDDISRLAAAATVDSPIPIGTRVGYLMPTPLGEVRGTAEVIRNEEKRLGGKSYYRSVLKFEEFDGQGRTMLQTLVNPSENSPLTPVLKPDKKSFLPDMKVPIFVAVLIAIPLIVLQTGIFRVTYNDDFFLKKIIDDPAYPNEADLERISKIYDETMKQSYPSTDRLVLLMSVLNRTNQKNDMLEVTKKLALRDRSNINLQLALLDAYNETREFDKAERDYKRLIEEQKAGKHPLTEQQLRNLHQSGARIAMRDGKYDEAAVRYEELLKQYPNEMELRDEFAWVLISGATAPGKNRTAYLDRAEQILLTKKGAYPEERKAKKLLMSVYMLRRGERDNEKDIDRAISLAEQITNSQPVDPEDRDLVAKVRMADNNYKMALETLAVLKQRPELKDDPKINLLMAQAELGLASKSKDPKDYEAALASIESVLNREEKGIYPLEEMKVFLDAASSVNRGEGEGVKGGPLSQNERNIALKIYYNNKTELANQPDKKLQADYLARLGWVLFRTAGKEPARPQDYDKLSKEEKEKYDSELAEWRAIQKASEDALQTARAQEDEPATKNLLAGVYIAENRWEDAAEIVGYDSPQGRKWRQIAAMKANPPQYDKALAIAQQSYKESPKDIENAIQLGEMLSLTKQHKEAEQHYAKLLAMPEFANHPKLLALQAEEAVWNAPVGQPLEYAKALDKLEPILSTDKGFSENKPLWQAFVDAGASAVNPGGKPLTTKQAEIAHKIADETLKGETAWAYSVGRMPKDDPEYQATITKNKDSAAKQFGRLAWVLWNAGQKSNNKLGDAAQQAQMDGVLALALKTTDPSATKELADILQGVGESGKAAELLGMVNPVSLTPEDHYKFAKMYVASQDWSKAETQLDAAIKAKPDYKDAQVLMADVVSWRAGPGDLDNAIKQFDALIKKYPVDLSLKIRKAEVQLWKQDNTSALNSFLELYAANPENQDVWLGLASAALGEGTPKMNLTQADINAPYIRAPITPPVAEIDIETKSKDTTGPIVRIPTNLEVLVPDRARKAVVEITQKVMKSGSKYPQSYAILAELNIGLQDRKTANSLATKAKKAVEAGIADKTMETITRQEGSRVLSALARYADAIDIFKGYDESKLNTQDLSNLALFSTQAENMDGAVRFARKLVEKTGGADNPKLLLADILSWKSDFNESLNIFEGLKAKGFDPEYIEPRIAEVRRWWRDYPTALRLYTKMLLKEERMKELQLRKGFIDATANAPRQMLLDPDVRRLAFSIYERTRKDIDKSAEYLSRLAWVFIVLGDLPKADEMLTRAVQLNKEKLLPETFRKEIAGVLEARGRYIQALDMLEGLEDKMDTDERRRLIRLLIAAGTATGRSGYWDRAEALFRQLLAQPNLPADTVKELKIGEAELLLWGGKFNALRYVQAQQAFNALHERYPDDEQLAVRLGQAYYFNKQYSEAIAHFEPLVAKIHRPGSDLTEDQRQTLQDLNRDIWMGYIDSMAGVVGNEIRNAYQLSTTADAVTAARAILTPARKEVIAKLYQMSIDIKPAGPTTSPGYAAALQGYVETLGRLGYILALMGEGRASNEAFNRAIALDQGRESLRLYAKALELLGDTVRAQQILERLMQRPEYSPPVPAPKTAPEGR